VIYFLGSKGQESQKEMCLVWHISEAGCTLLIRESQGRSMTMRDGVAELFSRKVSVTVRAIFLTTIRKYKNKQLLTESHPGHQREKSEKTKRFSHFFLAF
jgi:hypothetical protein